MGETGDRRERVGFLAQRRHYVQLIRTLRWHLLCWTGFLHMDKRAAAPRPGKSYREGSIRRRQLAGASHHRDTTCPICFSALSAVCHSIMGLGVHLPPLYTFLNQRVPCAPSRTCSSELSTRCQLRCTRSMFCLNRESLSTPGYFDSWMRCSPRILPGVIDGQCAPVRISSQASTTQSTDLIGRQLSHEPSKS